MNRDEFIKLVDENAERFCVVAFDIRELVEDAIIFHCEVEKVSDKFTEEEVDRITREVYDLLGKEKEIGPGIFSGLTTFWYFQEDVATVALSVLQDMGAMKKEKE
jgi:hypothetical protein